MDKCDVLIVGGGPAGSSLAWSLRHSGLDVIIMDKQGFPRNKTCAGWITPAVIKTLDLDTENYAHKRVLQPIHGFRIGQIGNDPIEINYADIPVSYGIRRCEFDHYLLQRCGARLLLDNPVKQIKPHNGKWIINNQIETGLLVGAGGYFCPVARYLGAKPGQNETAVMAQEIEFRMTSAQLAGCNIDPTKPELYFCPDLKGYGWILQKGEYLNIGLGREDKHKLSTHVEHFCRFLKEKNKIHFDIPSRFNGHAYLLYQHSVRNYAADGILLIGDAAGLAYTQSGEGIRPAIESGLIAGNIILQANGNYGIKTLSNYYTFIKNRFGVKKQMAGFSNQLPDKLKQFIARNVIKSSWFVRHILIDRWFLHSDQLPLSVN